MLSLLCNARTLAALALTVIICALAAHADTVILKDGYTIHGVKIKKEQDVVVDEKTGIPFVFDKANGLVVLDDGPRLVVFPPLQVADVNDNNKFRDFAAYTREREAGVEKLPSTARDAEILSDWDPKEWTRVVKFNDVDPRIKHTVKQHINVITPHYVRIGSSSHRLGRYFLLKEFKPDFIRKLLVNHPDLVEPKGKPDPERRERLIRFWIQADWLDEADKDLAQLLVALPGEKARYARLKGEVNSLRAEKRMAEIEQARDAGRHQWAIQALETFPKEDVPKTVATKVTALRADYENKTARFGAIKRYLDDLTKRAGASNPWLAEAAKAVRAEVHLDTLSRLDMFLTLAERAEKDAKEKDGRRPTYSPEELLSAAVTGWHLGKVAAEPKVASAYRCWMTRQMALDYLRTTVKGDRQRILNAYLAGPNALPYDELEKLVSLLPPPDAPSELPKGTAKSELVPTVAYPNGVSFYVRLPDDYQPGRSYPLLILLADPVQDHTPDYFLDRFGDLPAKHGYIVAAPQWWNSQKYVGYTYTREEQGTVLQLLRHLQRAFQVDSDRVFLWGNGEGGSMALDVGASHPDLFAGVVPVNPTVYQRLYIPAEYWVNFNQLPVYTIMGDRFGPSVDAIHMMAERWMPRGFPTLLVSYKGRGQEWFSEELPYAFDWMGRKRRSDPGKTVGPPRYEGRTTMPGFSSVRLSDNRFHWLSSDEIRPEATMNPVLNGRLANPAKFSARVLEGNTIEVKVRGMRQLTIWFGNGLVDYAKPVTVKLDRESKPVTKVIAPEIPVLMEDLYERGDRQRPYFARMDFKVPG
jgi:pimeloyl-ACP methyl ester carboxylesterase